MIRIMRMRKRLFSKVARSHAVIIGEIRWSIWIQAKQQLYACNDVCEWSRCDLCNSLNISGSRSQHFFNFVFSSARITWFTKEKKSIIYELSSVSDWKVAFSLVAKQKHRLKRSPKHQTQKNSEQQKSVKDNKHFNLHVTGVTFMFRDIFDMLLFCTVFSWCFVFFLMKLWSNRMAGPKSVRSHLYNHANLRIRQIWCTHVCAVQLGKKTNEKQCDRARSAHLKASVWYTVTIIVHHHHML